MGRGDDIERELIRHLWDIGIPAVRIPGSGGGVLRDLPDAIGKYQPKDLVMELKYTSGDYAYFEKEEVQALKRFAEEWDGEALLTARFSNDTNFYFIHVESKQTEEEMTSSGNISMKRKNREKYHTIEEMIDDETL